MWEGEWVYAFVGVRLHAWVPACMCSCICVCVCVCVCVVHNRVDSMMNNSQKNHGKQPVNRFDLGFDADFLHNIKRTKEYLAILTRAS